MIFVNFSRTPLNLYLQRQKKLLWQRKKRIRETNLRRCLPRLRLPFRHLRLLIQHRRTPPIRVRARAPTRVDHRLHPTAILEVDVEDTHPNEGVGEENDAVLGDTAVVLLHRRHDRAQISDRNVAAGGKDLDLRRGSLRMKTAKAIVTNQKVDQDLLPPLCQEAEEKMMDAREAAIDLDHRPKLSLRRKVQVIDDQIVDHHKGEETIDLAADLQADLHKEKGNTSVMVLPVDHLLALLALHHEVMDKKRIIARAKTAKARAKAIRSRHRK